MLTAEAARKLTRTQEEVDSEKINIALKTLQNFQSKIN